MCPIGPMAATMGSCDAALDLEAGRFGGIAALPSGCHARPDARSARQGRVRRGRGPGGVVLSDGHSHGPAQNLSDRFLQSPSGPAQARDHLLTAVIGEDPHVIVPLRRPPGRRPNAGNRSIDAFERPMGESRVGPPTMRLLVVADQIEINHRQAPGDVNFRADRRQLAHQNRNPHAGRHEFQLLPQVLPGDQAPAEVEHRQEELDPEKNAHAHQAVDAEQQDDEQPQRIPAPEEIVERHGAGTEVGLGRPARVDARIRTAPGQQGRTLGQQALFDAAGPTGHRTCERWSRSTGCRS